MKAKLHRMNTRKEDKRIDVGGQGSGEVVAYTGFQPVVKFTSVLQVILRLVKYTPALPLEQPSTALADPDWPARS